MADMKRPRGASWVAVQTTLIELLLSYSKGCYLETQTQARFCMGSRAPACLLPNAREYIKPNSRRDSTRCTRDA